ncbi:hypothetical protein FQZ97_1112930 [compost metagenome]
MHHPHEVLTGQLFQGGTQAEDRGVVQQAVQMTELGFDHGRQFIVLMRQRGFEVERDHRWLRMTGRFDFIVDLGQVGFGLAQ